jgi:Xaa-Pro aminopeptidase
MAQLGATHHFVSTVDDLAWITNLRGSDVDYNPVFLAHLLLDLTGATLFVGRRQDRPRAGRTAGRRRRANVAPYARPAPRWPRWTRQHAAGRPRRITHGLRQRCRRR